MSGFLNRLETGRTRGEEPVSRLLSRWFGVSPASPEEQAQGIDLWASRHDRHNAVEVKWSSRPTWHYLETHGPGLAEPGWLYSSKADIFALVTESERGAPYCLLLEADELRKSVQELIAVGLAQVSNGHAQDSGRPGGRGLWARTNQLQGSTRLYWLQSGDHETRAWRGVALKGE